MAQAPKRPFVDLTQLEKVIIKQPFRQGEWLMECLCGCEVSNKYEGMTKDNQALFDIEEDSNCCVRQCMGKHRCLDLDLIDANTGKRFIKIVRPYRMRCFCCSPKMCCGRDYMEVLDDEDNYLGSVGAGCSCTCRICYTLWDANDNVIGEIDRNCCICGCGDKEFPLFDTDGDTEIGKVTKEWGGLGKELFTDCDTFIVEFPQKYDNTQRYVFIAAAMLIEFMYFEADPNQDAQ